MLNSLVRVSRRGGWSTDLAIAAEGDRPVTGKNPGDLPTAAPSPLIKPSQGSQGVTVTGGFPHRPPSPDRTHPRRGKGGGRRGAARYQSARAFDVPSDGCGNLLRGEIRPPAPARGTGGGPAPVRTPRAGVTSNARPLGPADAIELNPLISIYEFHPFRLLTVSRTIELSLQSSFQLSLTVLVRYRSRGHI